MKWEMTKTVLWALVRWAVALLGFKLVEKGIIDQATADAWSAEIAYTLAGAIVLALAILWKYLNARFNILALIKAVQTDPPADTPREIHQAVTDVKQEVADSPVTTISY